MKNAAQTLMEVFGIESKGRTSKIEPLITMLLFTLNRNNLIQEAIGNITSYTDLSIVNENKIANIQALTSSPELASLQNDAKAIQVILQLLPYIHVAGEHEIVTLDIRKLESILNRKRKNHKFAELKRILRKVNHIALGYRLFQMHDSQLNEIHIIKYESRDDLIRILRENSLQMPSILDKVMG